MKNTLLIYLFLIGIFSATAQVGIGTTNPHASSALDITSTNSGILIPRMTFAQRNAITSPATGLMVFQTDNTPGFYYFEGTWKPFAGNSKWTAAGNDIYNANSGNVGVGTATPTTKLHVEKSGGSTGPFSQGFESGLVPMTSGGSVWTSQSTNVRTGARSARSGAIGNSAQTSMFYSATVPAGGATLSFWYKVDSELNWDFLEFYIDGTQVGSWSGNVPYSQFTTALAAGSHTFEWRYVKDTSGNTATDAAFIDDVSISNINIYNPAFRLVDGSQASGKVLISDANGNASWGDAGGSSPNTSWDLEGNAGTTPGTNFLGTTDNKNLLFKTNNSSHFEMSTAGNLLAYGNGTESAPIYSWQTDPNMGMYKIDTDVLGFSTNGIERIRIRENGNVAIGGLIRPQFDPPKSKLEIKGDDPYETVLYVTFDENITSDHAAGTFQNDNTAGGDGVIAHGKNGIFAETNNGPGGGYAGRFNGDVYVTGTVTQNSDERFKTNIVELKKGKDMLSKVMLLKPKSYNWRAAEFPGLALDPTKKFFGFIAQELKEIFPELVASGDIPDPKIKRGPRDPIKNVSGYYQVDYTGLIPILTEAIQEQQQIIETQETRIAKLEHLVEQLLNKK